MELTQQQKENYVVILLNTLKAFQSLCKEHNLTYYAGYGTCLGAVRHKGLIPWDDDIDVLMPRNDYNKLLELRHGQVGNRYSVVCPQDNGYYLPYAKFIDTSTTILERKDLPFLLGIYIDIFPIDDVGELQTAREISNNRTKYFYGYTSCLHKQNFKTLCRLIGSAKLKQSFWFLVHFLAGHILENYYMKRYNRNEKLIQQQQGDYCMYYGGNYSFEKECMPKSVLGNPAILPFEDFEICVPSLYDVYLKSLYNDYMTPPPVEKRTTHHFLFFFDLEKRWKIEDVLKLDLENQTIEYTYGE